MKQHLKSFIGLIVSFVHLIHRNHLWRQQIRRGKQILPKQIHVCAHLYHLYFIILCYKGRKDTIVPGGSQFTCYNLSVSLSLSFFSFFFLLVCFQTSDRICHFLPYFNYNSAVFYGIILQDKLHSFSIQDDRNTRLPSTTNYKNNSNIKRFYIENSPLDRTVQSGQSAIMQYAG